MKLQIKKNGSVINLKGELTIYSVAELFDTVSGDNAVMPAMCDLSEITKIDTAGFQLLLYLMKNSTENSGMRVEFKRAGEAVLNIFKLYGEQPVIS